MAKLQEMMKGMGGGPGGPGGGGMPPGMGGMPPGMGGPGGPGGGMGGPPPKPKAVSAGEAREALNGVMQALKSQAAGAEIQAAMKQAAQAAQAAPDQDPKMAAQKRMMALVPVMNKLTAQVTMKHGWRGGFMEAMASIGEHAKTNQDIARDLEPLRMLMMGGHPMAQKGKLPEFDALAANFGSLPKEQRDAVVLKTKAAIEKHTRDGKLKFPLAKFYLEVMGKIDSEGQGYVETEAQRMMKAMREKGVKDNAALKMLKRVNILGSFITKEDMERMRKQHQERQAAGGGGPPGSQ